MDGLSATACYLLGRNIMEKEGNSKIVTDFSYLRWCEIVFILVRAKSLQFIVSLLSYIQVLCLLMLIQYQNLAYMFQQLD